MEKFIDLRARAAALPRANVDTEVIIPINRLITFRRGSLGPYCFEPWRYDSSGAPQSAFSLNDNRFAGAQILVTGANFGCGSSREAAVWALWDMGFRCIIAESFGDIFSMNCFQNGLLTITLEKLCVEQILLEIQHEPAPMMRVDLAHTVLTTPTGRSVPFTIEAERRVGLLEGLDEVALTRKYAAEIDAFEQRDRLARPWAHLDK
jgi:3-isopropylmalate/(R)-2-methylmalate dehydratase small subunit